MPRTLSTRLYVLKFPIIQHLDTLAGLIHEDKSTDLHFHLFGKSSLRKLALMLMDQTRRSSGERQRGARGYTATQTDRQTEDQGRRRSAREPDTAS